MEQQSANSGGSAKRVPRRSFTMAERQQIVDEANVPGVQLAEVAKRHGIRIELLKKWYRQRLPNELSRKARAQFVAVHVDEIPTSGVIEIDLASGCVRVRGIVDAKMLREVLAAAR